MTLFPEKEKTPPIVEVIPQNPQIPPAIEKGTGVTPVPTQFTAQVSQGNQQLIQTPQNQTITITIPSPPEVLRKLAKGNIINSLTWRALYFLRLLKKALLYGWKVVRQS